MKPETWYWILGGVALYALSRQNTATAAPRTMTAAELNLPGGTGVFNAAAGTAIATGLSGLGQRRNFGPDHRARYRYQ